MTGNLVLLAILAFFIFPSYSESLSAAQKKEKPRKAIPAKKAIRVTELRELDQLKQAFQRDAGKIRFVTILSPT
jgi:hypothetical protein